ncbi:MAG: hypothetical protein HYX47_18585 [Burkholderiales bacterium]|nr:hypothetical protein [Burkholderiales bacterium]
MTKLIITAGLISLLAACSGMGNGSMSRSSGMSSPASTMGASGTMNSTGNRGGGPN